MERLFDPTYGNLSQVEFETWHLLAKDDGVEDTKVLATIGRDVPAIIERSLGAGKVMLFNTTANDTWSDLPRRKSFVYLVDRLVDYLAGGAKRGMFTIGETVILPLRGHARNAEVTVTTPGGNTLRPLVSQIAGQSVVQLRPQTEAGIYDVSYEGESGPVSFPFVVQPGENDSLFLVADEKTLRSWWQPAEVKFYRPDPQSGSIDLGISRVLFEPWMIFLACAVLLGEMFLVHRLCPKMNPGVAGGGGR